jgi:lipid II:glycine glycyltransferase (peptidoglycan interpeptide bridge formation enzyme)
MKIKFPSKSEWLEAIKDCSEATFFATPGWLEVVEKTFGNKAATKLFEFEDRQKVIVPISLIGKQYWICKHYISVPFYNYGGLFSNTEISNVKVNQIIESLTENSTAIVTMCPHPFSKVSYPCEFRADKYSTHILDLSQGFENIWSAYKDRDQARKAKKEGVTIRFGKTIDDFKKYYEIYLDSTKRWGLKEPQPFDLYKNLFNIAIGKIKLWFAMHDKKNIAGIILGYFNESVVYWGGAFFYEYGRLRPNNFLLIEAVKDAYEKGYKYFDFLPSAGIEGVENFKASFGAEKHEYYTYIFMGKLLKRASNIKQALMSKYSL